MVFLCCATVLLLNLVVERMGLWGCGLSKWCVVHVVDLCTCVVEIYEGRGVHAPRSVTVPPGAVPGGANSRPSAPVRMASQTVLRFLLLCVSVWVGLGCAWTVMDVCGSLWVLSQTLLAEFRGVPVPLCHGGVGCTRRQCHRGRTPMSRHVVAA